jgi:hypothetical protein
MLFWRGGRGVETVEPVHAIPASLNFPQTLDFNSNSSKIHNFPVNNKTSELLLMPVLQRRFGLQPIFDRKFSQNGKAHCSLSYISVSDSIILVNSIILVK